MCDMIRRKDDMKINKIKTVDLYTDGGVIKKNPSTIGGTYACVLVMDDKVQYRYSGIITPQNMRTKKVTNNQMELMAVITGFSLAKKGKHTIEHVYCDSQVTLGRLYQGWKLNGIPDWMVEMLNEYRPAILQTTGIHVRGHAGNKWNEECDRMCNDAGNRYLEWMNNDIAYNN